MYIFKEGGNYNLYHSPADGSKKIAKPRSKKCKAGFCPRCSPSLGDVWVRFHPFLNWGKTFMAA